MNEANIKYAIEVMKGAENLDMRNFQDGVCSTIEELHTCGNTACFVGYLCLTYTWREFFLAIDPSAECNLMGDVDFIHAPALLASYALAKFLDIEEDLAHGFIFNYNDDIDTFYPVEFSEVKPEHVIEKLEQLLAGTLV